MNIGESKRTRRILASVLAGVMLGTAVPAFAAENPAFEQQQAAAADNGIQSEAKLALLQEALALNLGLEQFSGSIDETARRKGLDLAEQAVIVSEDPSSSVSEVAAIRKKVKAAADKQFLDYMQHGAYIKLEISRLINYTLDPAYNPTSKYPQEAIDSALAKLNALEQRLPTVGLKPADYVQAYQEYLSIHVGLDMQAYWNNYESLYVRARDYANSEIERVKDIDEDYSNLREAFEKRIETLRGQLDSARSEAELAYVYQKMSNSYAALLHGIRLVTELHDARLLLDSPRSSGSGQYPASAVGTLRRAVNEAASQLDKARTWDDVNYAQSDLYEAVQEFRSRQIP
ncbi:hypothetical protein [Saccharibacillus qingshengii]|uniref:hypothetical protein n=1 Tax=Saccharibacillus qingshengii TaxID=1763540 RepID=UPI0015526B99|nr:hypothetical protein [Saccharibacillus qingshengii]